MSLRPLVAALAAIALIASAQGSSGALASDGYSKDASKTVVLARDGLGCC